MGFMLSVRRFLGLAVSQPHTGEIGYQSDALPGWGDLRDETHETNPDLIWPESINVYDRMRREDPQVASVLLAVTQPILCTPWMIDPAGARDEVVEHVAANFGLPIKGRDVPAPPRTRDRFSWEEHVRLALLQLTYGHSVFEQVYRIENGRAHIRKLAWRPPRTISKFDVAQDGGLIAIEQYGLGGKDRRIPVDRLVAYVNDREGPNWLGTSLLRPAYKMWLLKDRALRTGALTLERNGLGVPVYTGAPLPDALVSDDEREKWAAADRAAGLKIAKQFRAGDAAGASLPHGATLELKGVTGTLPNSDKQIRYYDEQIARAVLAHFLNLGTQTGSWALGSTFADFFTNSLNAVADQIADVAQQHIVEDLVDVNWGSDEPAPRLVPSTIGEDQPVTAESLQALISSGAVKPDDDLEAYMRTRYRLPVKATAADGDGTGDPNVVDDAERARLAAETIQKVYLGVGPVITTDEARRIADRAGAQLNQEGT